ncbi:MAG: 5,6-dimethylbenzimidazole synthase [Candidatus Tumulicola sp.]
MNSPQFDEAFRAKLRELFEWRRDVRHFRSDPVDGAVLERLVRTASLAPSVGFSQPWRFVCVDDAARRDAVVASFERANAGALAEYGDDDAARYARLKLAGLREAPVHLAVFNDESTQVGRGLGTRTMPETRAYSTAVAVYTFWLAARAEGIGVGWVSILEPHQVERALDVPAQWTLVAYLCVGYPKEEHDTPELLRAGWEFRDERATTLHRR